MSHTRLMAMVEWWVLGSALFFTLLSGLLWQTPNAVGSAAAGGLLAVLAGNGNRAGTVGLNVYPITGILPLHDHGLDVLALGMLYCAGQLACVAAHAAFDLDGNVS